MTFFVTAYKAGSPESPAHITPHRSFLTAWIESSALRTQYADVFIEGDGLRIRRSTYDHASHHDQAAAQSHDCASQ